MIPLLSQIYSWFKAINKWTSIHPKQRTNFFIMYLTLVSFPGVIKGLWAVRTNDHKCTFMSTLIICSSIMFVRWWGVFWCLPEAKRAPTRGTTKAFAAIGQQRVNLTGNTGGYIISAGGFVAMKPLHLSHQHFCDRSSSFEDSWSDFLSYGLILREVWGYYRG